MKILILGQGGREHALIKAFKKSSQVSEIHIVPGNDGMKKEAVCHHFPMTDCEKIIDLCLRTSIDFVFIGPEDPLVAGVADKLRERGILVVGPNKNAAMLEGSKIFAKEFMMQAQVPTAKYFIVSSVMETLNAAKNFQPPYVLKADGLAAGKGVFICKNIEELKESAISLFEKLTLGDAGKTALLEEFSVGWELSFLVLTNGQKFISLPLAQDHKRLKDNNQGPNTGGMGTVAPLNIDPSLLNQIENKIIKPSIDLIHEKQFIFRGVLFVGIMVTPSGPKVLEYNVRFGDPETQVILPLIEQDLAVVMKSLSQGSLTNIHFNNLHSCCVILASPGYPDSSSKNIEIIGIDNLTDNSNSYLIHSGTKHNSQKWLTNGGRVLGCVGLGSNRDEAIKNAYSLSDQISWDGLQKRLDIGKYDPN